LPTPKEYEKSWQRGSQASKVNISPTSQTDYKADAFQYTNIIIESNVMQSAPSEPRLPESCQHAATCYFQPITFNIIVDNTICGRAGFFSISSTQGATHPVRQDEM